MKGESMPNLEEAIRERAYQLWMADGQPGGQADVYWLNAQREILTLSLGSSGSEAAASARPDAASAATTPTKKTKAARSGKSKAHAG
jgi:hypothetical protein